MTFIARSMRHRMERLTGEPQLFAMAMLVCFVGFLAGLPSELARVPQEARLQAVGWLFTGAMFFGPLLLIGLAAFSHLIARQFGGQASWQEARLALIWALVLSIPLLLISRLGPSWLALLCLIGTGGIWAVTLAEAERFQRVLWVFATIAVLPTLCLILIS